MYAIAFDLEISELKKHYGDPYNNAYFEIKSELAKIEFDWTQGSVYLLLRLFTLHSGFS